MLGMIEWSLLRVDTVTCSSLQLGERRLDRALRNARHFPFDRLGLEPFSSRHRLHGRLFPTDDGSLRVEVRADLEADRTGL